MANVLMAPGALDAQQEEIQRRMKFAEALQNPIAEQGRMVGNHFVSFNPLAGLADMLRAKLGADERKGAQQELQDLGTKRQEMMSNALKTFGQLSNPSQAGTGDTNLVNDALPPEMQIGAQSQMAQRKPDMQGAYASLIESGIPALQQMGTQGMIQMPQIAAQQQERKDAREASHAQQMEVLKQRAEDARSTMQERLQAQREMQANQLAFQQQNAEANRAQQASMARLAASLRQPQQAQIIQTDTGPMQLVGGKAVPIVGPTGQPVGSKGAVNGNQKAQDAKDAIAAIDMAEKLIDKATGSGIGSAIDTAAGFFGKSTSGAQAGAQLKAIEGDLVAKMPKMSGPQSDKDVLLYRQMAGQIGDPSVPRETKKAALLTIREIQGRYAGNGGVSAEQPNAGWSIAPVQ
jgi:hypothetical protein